MNHLFRGSLLERDAHSQARIAHPYITQHMRADPVQFKQQVDDSAHRIGGGHLDITAMHADIGEGTPGMYVAAIDSKLRAALTFVARALATFLGRRRSFLARGLAHRPVRHVRWILLPLQVPKIIRATAFKAHPALSCSDRHCTGQAEYNRQKAHGTQHS